MRTDATNWLAAERVSFQKKNEICFMVFNALSLAHRVTKRHTVLPLAFVVFFYTETSVPTVVRSVVQKAGRPPLRDSFSAMAAKRVLSDVAPAVFPLFAAKKTKREITTGAWSKYKGSLLVGDYGTPEASSKIAAFDLVCEAGVEGRRKRGGMGWMGKKVCPTESLCCRMGRLYAQSRASDSPPTRMTFDCYTQPFQQSFKSCMRKGMMSVNSISYGVVACRGAS